MTTPPPFSPRIAIIGAGMAGLTCAQDLKTAGFAPTVFEKSRGYGGRISTRFEGTDLTFDHGAQYVTAKTEAFQSHVSEASRTGDGAVWTPSNCQTRSAHAWFVGKPGMNALVKPLMQDLDIRYRTHVSRIHRENGSWCLSVADGDAPLRFDYVVISAPAPQTRALIGKETEISIVLSKIRMAPCWALMAAFDQELNASFDVIKNENADLAWVARNTSKPGRSPGLETWVAHASPEWSETNLERDKESVLPDLLSMFEREVGRSLPEPRYATAHRWRYALTTAPLSLPFISTADQTLMAVGDWCLGARVECAYQSGLAAGQALRDALRA